MKTDDTDFDGSGVHYSLGYESHLRQKPYKTEKQMKTSKTYYHNGQFLFLEGDAWPEEPQSKYSGYMGESDLLAEDRAAEIDYNEELTSVLERAVPFEDQVMITAMVRRSFGPDFYRDIKEGLYTIPEIEVEVIHSIHCPTNMSESLIKRGATKGECDCKPVARIISQFKESEGTLNNDNKVTPDLEKPDFESSINQAIRSLGWDLDVSSESNDMIKLANYIKRTWISPIQKELLELKAENQDLTLQIQVAYTDNQICETENERLKEKEIRGDRMIVDLEHQKTVLKAELSEAKELLDKYKIFMQKNIPSVQSGLWVLWLAMRDEIESFLSKCKSS